MSKTTERHIRMFAHPFNSLWETTFSTLEQCVRYYRFVCAREYHENQHKLFIQLKGGYNDSCPTKPVVFINSPSDMGLLSFRCLSSHILNHIRIYKWKWRAQSNWIHYSAGDDNYPTEWFIGQRSRSAQSKAHTQSVTQSVKMAFDFHCVSHFGFTVHFLPFNHTHVELSNGTLCCW